MSRDEFIRTTGRLVGDVLAGGVGVVRDVHRAVADRWFGVAGPVAWPARALHNGIAGGVYAIVGTAHALAPRVGSAVAAGVVAGVTTGGVGSGALPRADASRARLVLAAVNGLWGDRISDRYPALAIPMTVRCQGADVALTTDGLRTGQPGATSRLAVFVHGLCEDDRSWVPSPRGQHADAQTEYGSLLRRDLGYTPVFVRYNTGQRVSDNGRRLAALMGELVDRWPVPVDEVVFVGHSMGGLVVRAACHYGRSSGDAWVRTVRHVFCLGTPHLGAPLEKGANAAAWLLSRLPETAPMANVLNLRSVGVKDLRYGALVEEDWHGVDMDEFLRDRCTEVPFLEYASYYFVGATVTGSPDHPVGRLLGDLLVQFPSASGHGARRRIPFAVEHGRHLGGLHHFDLLHHPSVYHQLRTWLTDARDKPAATPPPPSAAGDRA
jgi:hypothetical protein